LALVSSSDVEEYGAAATTSSLCTLFIFNATHVGRLTTPSVRHNSALFPWNSLVFKPSNERWQVVTACCRHSLFSSQIIVLSESNMPFSHSHRPPPSKKSRKNCQGDGALEESCGAWWAYCTVLQYFVLLSDHFLWNAGTVSTGTVRLASTRKLQGRSTACTRPIAHSPPLYYVPLSCLTVYCRGVTPKIVG